MFWLLSAQQPHLTQLARGFLCWDNIGCFSFSEVLCTFPSQHLYTKTLLIAFLWLSFIQLTPLRYQLDTTFEESSSLTHWSIINLFGISLHRSPFFFFLFEDFPPFIITQTLA